MEKRLAASVAGLAELATLRDKHKREMEELFNRLSIGQNELTEEDSSVPPPVPIRKQSHPISHHIASRPPPPPPPPRGTVEESQADGMSTFRRPRQMSATVYSYPSPMHAVLMQYPQSDTKKQQISRNEKTCTCCLDKNIIATTVTEQNDSGFLETTFPSAVTMTCCQCQSKQNADNHRQNYDDNIMFGGANDPCSVAGIRRLLTLRETQQCDINEGLCETSNVGQTPKPSSQTSTVQDGSNLSHTSEEGYFSSSEHVLSSKNNLRNCQRQSMSSVISNDSCYEEEDCSTGDTSLKTRINTSNNDLDNYPLRSSSFTIKENGQSLVYQFSGEFEGPEILL